MAAPTLEPLPSNRFTANRTRTLNTYADTEYREAITTYVDLVKKRQARRQQQSARLRSLLSKQSSSGSAAEPLALETFYSAEPNSAEPNTQLNGNGSSPQLAAAGS